MAEGFRALAFLVASVAQADAESWHVSTQLSHSVTWHAAHWCVSRAGVSPPHSAHLPVVASFSLSLSFMVFPFHGSDGSPVRGSSCSSDA